MDWVRRDWIRLDWNFVFAITYVVCLRAIRPSTAVLVVFHTYTMTIILEVHIMDYATFKICFLRTIHVGLRVLLQSHAQINRAGFLGFSSLRPFLFCFVFCSRCLPEIGLCISRGGWHGLNNSLSVYDRISRKQVGAHTRTHLEVMTKLIIMRQIYSHNSTSSTTAPVPTETTVEKFLDPENQRRLGVFLVP